MSLFSLCDHITFNIFNLILLICFSVGKVGRANPFKVMTPDVSPAALSDCTIQLVTRTVLKASMGHFQVSGKPMSSSGQPRVTNILDNMTTSRKSTPLSGSAGKSNKTPVLKPLAPRPKAKVIETTTTQTQIKCHHCEVTIYLHVICK